MRMARPRRTLPTTHVAHITWRDLLNDVAQDLLTRPGRTLLTALGTLVGIAVLVGTLGLASSLESQIIDRFNAIAPREVSVTPAESGPESPVNALPWDSPARARRIQGVVTAADFTELTPPRPVRGSPVHDPARPEPGEMRIIAASPQVFETVGARMLGSAFTDFNEGRGDAVAVVGREAADRLGIKDIRGRPVIFVDGSPVIVIGIINEVSRQSIVLGSVVVPESFARNHLALTAPNRVLVLTSAGAAATVARQLPVAIKPNDSAQVRAEVPPVAEATRDAVTADIRGLLIALAVVALAVGGVGIANVTLVAVLQRTAEIGLRRAIGARQRDILAHFLLCSTITGLVGAVIGTCMGAWTTFIVAHVQGWPPTFDRWMLLAGPAIGALVGLLAGIYPSYKAATIEPIDALRAGT